MKINLQIPVPKAIICIRMCAWRTKPTNKPLKVSSLWVNKLKTCFNFEFFVIYILQRYPWKIEYDDTIVTFYM